MSLRIFFMLLGLFVLLAVPVSSIADEVRTPASQEPCMSIPVPAQSASQITEEISMEVLVGTLRLKMYEAAMGDLSLCKDDEICLRHAKRIKDWVCAANVCDGKGKEPLNCLEGRFDEYSKDVIKKVNASLCTLIKSPSSKIRQVLLNLIKKVEEDSMVEYPAYVFAIGGDSERCEGYIKDYVGAYDSSWNNKWYRALSGCRILAHESTREQEEKDFYTWIGIKREFNCSQIVNNELRSACQTPGAPPPGDSSPRESFFSSVEFLIDQLHLDRYEAAAGDLSLCKDDKTCLRRADRIKAWFCAARICDEENKTKTTPADCLKPAGQYSTEDLNQINTAICALIKSPSSETRRVILDYVSEAMEDSLIEYGGYLFATKGSSKKCEDYIKGYVGAYGSSWNNKWYGALSGCRILAHESTREQEEKDFYTWIEIKREFNCSQIVNSELRSACQTPGTTPLRWN